MNKKLVTSLIVFILLLAGAAFAFSRITRPGGPALELTPLAVSTQPLSGAATPAVASVSDRPIPAQPAAQDKPCGGSGSINLLMLGLALDNDPRPPGVDGIRLVRVNFDSPAVTVMALPPKLWVDTPALAAQGIEQSELTELYVYAKQQAESSADTAAGAAALIATRAVAQTLMDNFGFRTGNYFSLDQPLFAEMVDTLGGIDMDIPGRVDGTSEGRGLFEPGPQHLDGQRALDYISISRPGGARRSNEWARIARQNQVLKVLVETAGRPENWSKAPVLLEQYRRAVTTDLSVRQLWDLSCLVRAVGSDAQLVEIERDMVTEGQDGRLFPEKEKIRLLIEQNFGK